MSRMPKNTTARLAKYSNHCAYRVLEEQDLAIICGHQYVQDAVKVDVIQQRRSVHSGLEEGLKPGQLATVAALNNLQYAARGRRTWQQRAVASSRRGAPGGSGTALALLAAAAGVVGVPATLID